MRISIFCHLNNLIIIKSFSIVVTQIGVANEV